MTELQSLKKKCLTEKGVIKKDASEVDLKRMKQLQDAEPVSAEDIAIAEKREEERKEKDVADFKVRQQEKSNTANVGGEIRQPADPALDKIAQQEHPRIAKLKAALLPFSQIQQDPGRDASTVLITRGVSITAGDVRNAIGAMQV